MMKIQVPVHPKALRDSSECSRRKSLVLEPHVAPLTRLVERIRRETGRGHDIPFFDPLDGGTAAECIFILQAPGARAVNSGFVSRDNNDESARHFFELTRDAGLDRHRTVTWNAIPWHQDGSTIGAGDLETGLRYLEDMFRELDGCRAIVLLGRRRSGLLRI